MKLYSHPMQPNAIRVLTFIDEKGMHVPVVDLDMLGGEHKSPEYLQKNAHGQVPTLELDDGSCLTESIVICRYLDELSGQPFLFGDDVRTRAFVSMWERKLELGLFIPAVEYGHHTIPEFKPFFQQHPDWAESLRPGIGALLVELGEQLRKHEFVAGEQFSVADITGFLGVKYADELVGLKPANNGPLMEWMDQASERVGARAWHRGLELWPSFKEAVGKLSSTD